MYASFLGISEALHMDIFQQPLGSRFFDSLIITWFYFAAQFGNIHLNLGNLAPWVRSESIGLAGKDSRLFWSRGVLTRREKTQTRFQLK
jgi:hypothetical protein